MSKTIKKLSVAFTILLFSSASFSVFGQGYTIDNSAYRIALSFDGNSWDDDDMIAAPIALAILADAGLKSRLVFCDYSNNLVKDDSGDPAKMNTSIDGTVSRWGYSSSLFYEARVGSELTAAKTAFANAAKSAWQAGERLFYVVGGPMEVPNILIDHITTGNLSGTTAANITAIKANIVCVSHSTWNENFGSNNTYNRTGFPTWAVLKTKGVKTVEIEDQNTYDGNNDMSTPISKWNFLKTLQSGTTDKYEWLFNQNPFGNKFDPSDAGMLWWTIMGRQGWSSTGSQHQDLRNGTITTAEKNGFASPAKINTLFSNAIGGGDACSGNTAPTLSVAASYNTSGTGRLVATATDNGTIAKVEFYKGTTLLGTLTTPNNTNNTYRLVDSRLTSGSGYSVIAYDNCNATKTVTGTMPAPAIVAQPNTNTLSGEKIMVSPNPAINTLWVKGDIQASTIIRIINLDGREVLRSKGNNLLQVSQLTSGMYLVQVDGQTVSRFVKQ